MTHLCSLFLSTNSLSILIKNQGHIVITNFILDVRFCIIIIIAIIAINVIIMIVTKANAVTAVSCASHIPLFI